MDIMDGSAGNVLGLRINGTLTGDDYAGVVPTIERLIGEHDKVRMLVRFDQLTGVEPEAVWEDFKLGRHIRDFGRMAIVADREWIRRFAGMMSAVAPMPVRHFPLADEDAAWRWLRE